MNNECWSWNRRFIDPRRDGVASEIIRFVDICRVKRLLCCLFAASVDRSEQSSLK